MSPRIILSMSCMTVVLCMIIVIQNINSRECTRTNHFISKFENVFVNSELSSVYHGQHLIHPFWQSVIWRRGQWAKRPRITTPKEEKKRRQSHRVTTFIIYAASWIRWWSSSLEISSTAQTTTSVRVILCKKLIIRDNDIPLTWRSTTSPLDHLKNLPLFVHFMSFNFAIIFQIKTGLMTKLISSIFH